MLTLFYGDDTAANNRSIYLRLPTEPSLTGFSFGFEFHGVTKTGAYSPGATVAFNYTRSETLSFPLGLSYARLYVEKDGLRETVVSSMPVIVTDCRERCDMATNDINITIKINTGVTEVTEPELTAQSTVGDIKRLANAMRASINGTAT